jgi:hypothetical protein
MYTGFSAAAGAGTVAVAVAGLRADGGDGIDLRLIRFDREGIFVERVELLDLFRAIFFEPTGPLGIAFDGSGFGVVVSLAGGDLLPVLLRWALLP